MVELIGWGISHIHNFTAADPQLSPPFPEPGLAMSSFELSSAGMSLEGDVPLTPAETGKKWPPTSTDVVFGVKVWVSRNDDFFVENAKFAIC